jgi:hypothetical protein
MSKLKLSSNATKSQGFRIWCSHLGTNNKLFPSWFVCSLLCKNWLQAAIRACEKFITFHEIIAYVLPLFNVGLLWCLSPSLHYPNHFRTSFLSLFLEPTRARFVLMIIIFLAKPIHVGIHLFCVFFKATKPKGMKFIFIFVTSLLGSHNLSFYCVI